MKKYELNYCSRFKCKAGDCKHTCCAGWEMCIDQQTLERYTNEKSAFSTKLLQGINLKKGKFKADKQKRCAFLNDSGLCEIIINLGEDNLCQVCRDHPRFRAFFSDREETGLGLSCEVAVELVLTYKDKISPVLIFDDGEKEELTFIEKKVLEFRNMAIDLVQDRTKPITQRIKELLYECKAQITEKDYNKFIKRLISFEGLCVGWKKRLKAIKKTPLNFETDSHLSLMAEQFLVNGLYRHISGAEDVLSARARAVACVISWLLVLQLAFKSQGEEGIETAILEVVREFSAEVEYSQRNLDKLFSFSSGLIGI